MEFRPTTPEEFAERDRLRERAIEINPQLKIDFDAAAQAAGFQLATAYDPFGASRGFFSVYKDGDPVGFYDAMLSDFNNNKALNPTATGLWFNTTDFLIESNQTVTPWGQVITPPDGLELTILFIVRYAITFA